MTQEPTHRAEPTGAPEEGALVDEAADAPPADGVAAAEQSAAPGEQPEPTVPTESTGPTQPTGEDVDDDLTRAHRDLAELTSDLQRLQAEFLNYKRRVDRDRDLIRENATYAALAPITEVLDTIDRAREHGPLEPGLKAVADQLERAVTGLGLRKFGAPGDPFDPTLHEALSHIGEDPDVAVTTCKVVAKAGYRLGDRVVRAAQVLVVDPAGDQVEDATEPTPEEPGTDEGDRVE